jgi:tetratricopeptide (TPR) repeat protein
MAVLQDESGTIRPASLDASAVHEWRQLSLAIIRARRTGSWSGTNVTLEAAAAREPQSPATPAYRLWIADNFARDGRYADAIAAYDAVIASAQSASRLFPADDPVRTVLFDKAQALALSGDAATAIATFRERWRHAPNDATPLLRAGLLAEEHGNRDDAAELYRTAASGTPSRATDDPAELARRALQRLEQTAAVYAADPYQLRHAIAAALERRDGVSLERLVSRTHFAVGPGGGHTSFEDLTMFDELLRDLGRSRIKVKNGLLGTGANDTL